MLVKIHTHNQLFSSLVFVAIGIDLVPSASILEVMETQPEPCSLRTEEEKRTYNQHPELQTAHAMLCFSSLKVPPPHCTHWHSAQDLLWTSRTSCQMKIKGSRVSSAAHLSIEGRLGGAQCTASAVCIMCRCICVCVNVAVGDRWVEGTSRHSVPESSVLPWSRPLVSMVIFFLRLFALLTHWNWTTGLSGEEKKVSRFEA